MGSRLEDFDYELPEERIAQHPPRERDGGRLMRLERQTGAITHHRIADLPGLLVPRSVLVVNDSRVFPARLFARRPTGGRVELLLLERLSDARWYCMLRASKPPRRGEELVVEGDARGTARRTVRLMSEVRDGRGEIELGDPTIVDRLGTLPLPPYIRRPADDVDAQRYQTLFARHQGSVAAPTAGLHFSPRLLANIEQRDVAVCPVTLHVGPGTFVPVRTEDPSDHRMESERYEVPASAAAAIASARRDSRPVVAVGTTVVRALETSAGQAGSGRTELFIKPGYRFRAVDALLTNFHLPRSTLLMLVCAFGGREPVLAAYRDAVSTGYRFYSYGDAMLIV